jgi:hypothetical protein
MELGRKDDVHLSARRPIHQECGGYRPNSSENKVSPKGPSSGMRMLTFYINRAGKELTESRQKELEEAKRPLSTRIRNQKKDS